MKNLSLPAKAYIGGMIVLGAILTPWQVSQLRLEDLALVAAVSILAAVAQVLKVEGPTERSSYNISWVAYGLAFLTWGAPAAMLVILVSHLVEWVKHRYPWYIQLFNIGSFAFVVSAARLVYDWIDAEQTPAGLPGFVAAVSAALVFTLLNHLVVGAVLKLARGQSFAESGVFEHLTLIIDFTLFGMGITGAFIWVVNPFAVVLAGIPLYLIYITLRVPALQRQTQVDPKTGLFNSKYFTQALEKELARAERFDRPLTVVMADLDLLRNINNSYGHLAGDAALAEVSNILRAKVRDYDVVARFGGEEFAILMPETTSEQAYPRVEECRAAIEAARINISTSVDPIRVTMSFGIAGRERFGQKPEDIVHSADLAVYQAKLSGRNRTCRYSSEGIEDVTSIAPLAADRLSSEPARPAEAEAPPPSSSSSLEPPKSPDLPSAPAEPSEASKPQLQAPVIRPRPAWAVNVYIAVLLILAAGVWCWFTLSQPPPAMDGVGLGIFVTLLILTEVLSLDIYVRETSISTATAPLVAGSLLFGPIGALLLSLALAGAAMVKHRSALSRFLFNFSNHLISIVLGIVVAGWICDALGAKTMLSLALATVAATGISYFSSTWLLAGVIDLSSGQAFRRVWAERFQWLWPYYLGLGMLAFTLIFSFQSSGLLGIVATIVPLLVVRFGQAQYIAHTQGLVGQLRNTNAELHKKSNQISQLNEELLLALSRAIDLRDPDVQDHSLNVSRYATLIASEMNLPPERVELVRKAGLLHDIGKLGIPEVILFKPARLTPAEYEIIKEHAAMGADIVAASHALSALVPVIRHHHERYDGQGYPAGLKDHDIPLEARIISLADTIEAMASDRPYRQAISSDAILAEIRAHTGTQFDPEIVNAFLQVIHKHGESIIVNSARRTGVQWGNALSEENQTARVTRSEQQLLHRPLFAIHRQQVNR
jgi:diguanylate cyclase (GGDEF)-like protein/putative nucleotidyltransferase with HDIG domain